MGAIDLDPASCALANETVQAQWYLTTERVSSYGQGVQRDGLAVPWGPHREQPTRVLLNPPGGALKRNEAGLWVPAREREGKGSGRASSSTGVWWAKLCEEFFAGRVKEAIFVGFTLEILMRSQHYGVPIQHFARCYPKTRLEFTPLDGQANPGAGHANVIAFLSHEPNMSFPRFRHAFEHIGFCEPGHPI